MVYIIISIMLLGLIIRVGIIGGGVDNNKANRNRRGYNNYKAFYTN